MQDTGEVAAMHIAQIRIRFLRHIGDSMLHHHIASA
jgi:hypothetical protein